MKQVRIIGLLFLCFLFLGCSRKDEGNETTSVCPDATCPEVECPTAKCPEPECPNVEANQGDEGEPSEDEDLPDNEGDSDDERDISEDEDEEENPEVESTPPSGETYIIQAGDTLKSIAEKLGVTVEELQAWNQISDPNTIFVGQVLNVGTSGVAAVGINQIIEDFVGELEATNNVEGSAITEQTMFQDERFVSILFTGEVGSGAYPRPLKGTLNVDLDQGTRLTLDQMVAIDEAFTDQVTLLFQEQFDTLVVDMRAVLTSDIATYLSQADRGNAPDIQSYFTSSELIILLSVPHAIGDYIEVRMPLSTIDFII